MSNVTFVITFFSLGSFSGRQVNHVEEAIKSRIFIDALKQSKNLIRTPTAKLRHTTHEHLLFSPPSSCFQSSSSSHRRQQQQKASSFLDLSSSSSSFAPYLPSSMGSSQTASTRSSSTPATTDCCCPREGETETERELPSSLVFKDGDTSTLPRDGGRQTSLLHVQEVNGDDDDCGGVTTADHCCVGGNTKASAALICVPGATGSIPRARLITMWADYVCIVDFDDEAMTSVVHVSSALLVTPNANAPSPCSGVAEAEANTTREAEAEAEEKRERERERKAKHEHSEGRGGGQISDILLVMAAAKSSHVPVLVACRSIRVFHAYVELARSRRDLRGLAVYWLELGGYGSQDALVTPRRVAFGEMASSLLTALSPYCPRRDFFDPSSQALIREDELLWEVDPALAVQRVSSSLTRSSNEKSEGENGPNDEENQKGKAEEYFSFHQHNRPLHLRSPLVRDFSIRCALPLRLSYITSFGQQRQGGEERGGRGRGGRGRGAVGSCGGRGMGAVAHLCFVVQGTLRVGDRLVTGVPDSYITRDLDHNNHNEDDDEEGGGIVRESNEIVLEIRPYPSFFGPTLEFSVAVGCATRRDRGDEPLVGGGDRVDSINSGGGDGVLALSTAVSGQFVTIVTTNTRVQRDECSSQNNNSDGDEEEAEDAGDDCDAASSSSIRSEARRPLDEDTCTIKNGSSEATTRNNAKHNAAANKKSPLPRGGRRGKRKPRGIWDMRTGGDVHEWQSVPCLFTRFNLPMGTLLCRPGRGALLPAWLASFNVVGNSGKSTNKRLLCDDAHTKTEHHGTPRSSTPTTAVVPTVKTPRSLPAPSSQSPTIATSPIIKSPLYSTPTTTLLLCATTDETASKFKLSNSDVAHASLITRDGVVTHRSLYLVREVRPEATVLPPPAPLRRPRHHRPKLGRSDDDDGDDYQDETEKEANKEGKGGSSSSSSSSVSVRRSLSSSFPSSRNSDATRAGTTSSSSCASVDSDCCLMYESVSKGSSARCDAVTLDTHLHCLPSVVDASNMYAYCTIGRHNQMIQRSETNTIMNKTLLDSAAVNEDEVSSEGEKMDKKGQAKEQGQQAFGQQRLENEEEGEEEEYKGWQKALLVVNHPTRRNEIIKWFIVAIGEKVPKIQVARAVASCLRAHGSEKVPPCSHRHSPRSAVPIAPLYPPQLFDEREYDLARFCDRSFLRSLLHHRAPSSSSTPASSMLRRRGKWPDPADHREAAAALLLLIHPLPLAYWRSHSLLVSSSSSHHGVGVDFTNGFPEDKSFLSPFVLMMDITASSTFTNSDKSGEGLCLKEELSTNNTYTANNAKTVALTDDDNGRTCYAKSVFGRNGHVADILDVLSNVNLYLSDDMFAQRSSGGAYGGGGVPFYMHTANGGTRLEDALYLRHKGSRGAADRKPLLSSTAIFQEEVIRGAIVRAIRSSRHALRILLEAASPLPLLPSSHPSLSLVRDAQRAALESLIDDVPFVRTFEQNIKNPNLVAEEWGRDTIGDCVRKHTFMNATRPGKPNRTADQEDGQVSSTCSPLGPLPALSQTQEGSLFPHHTAPTTTIKHPSMRVLSKARHKRCLFTVLLSHMISPMPGESPSDVYIPHRVRDFIIGNYFSDPRGPVRYEERTLYYTLRSFRATSCTATTNEGHANCGGHSTECNKDNWSGGGSSNNAAQSTSSGYDGGDSLGVSAALVPRRVLPPHILLYGLLCPYQTFAAAADEKEEEELAREGFRLLQNTLSDFLYMPDYTGLELFALSQSELMEMKFSMGKGCRDRISSGTAVLILRSEATLRRWAASSCLDFLFDSDLTKDNIASLLVDVAINGKGSVLLYRPSSVEDYDTSSSNKAASQQYMYSRGMGRGRGMSRALSGGRGGEGGGGGPIMQAVERVLLHVPRTEERMCKAYHDNKWPLLSSASCFPLQFQQKREEDEDRSNAAPRPSLPFLSSQHQQQRASPIVLVEANVSALIRMYCFTRALSSVAAAADHNCDGRDGSVYGHEKKKRHMMCSTNTVTLTPTSENNNGSEQAGAIRRRKAAFLAFSPRILQIIFSFLN